jgi:hypothetical protein
MDVHSVMSGWFSVLFSKYITTIPPAYVFCVCSDILLVCHVYMAIQSKSYSDLSILKASSGCHVLHWLSGLRPSPDTHLSLKKEKFGYLLLMWGET